MNAPDVAFVEQDQTSTIASTQLGAAWGLDRIDQSILPLEGSHKYSTTGAGVNVYIIDSGIGAPTLELGGRVVVPAFSAINDGCGVDGCHWHGTHVAGIIGGAVYGVAKSATLYSVRPFDGNGVGATSDIIAGVDWVTSNHVLAAVANLSISSPASSALNAAVQNSINAGITYAVAARNNVGADACNYLTGERVDALTVAAITGNDAQTTYTKPATNSSPTASFTSSCRKANCSFNASGSRDDHGIVSYAWTFGDGASQTGSTPLASHVYKAKGTYAVTITLTVTDAAGATGSTQKTVTIKNGR